MNPEVLQYYYTELDFLHSMLEEFAGDYPAIAESLGGLEAGATRDPHVERLISAVALLNARTRYKLDFDYPVLTDAVIGILYPHYQRPLPSATIVEFTPAEPAYENPKPATLPAGAIVETRPIQDQACTFRTCAPVDVWPIEVVDGALTDLDRAAGLPAIDDPGEQARSVLAIRLRALSPALSFDKLRPGSLRLHLAGSTRNANSLFELLCHKAVAVAVVDPGKRSNHRFLDVDAIRPAMLDDDEALLPRDPRARARASAADRVFQLPAEVPLRRHRSQDAGRFRDLGIRPRDGAARVF